MARQPQISLVIPAWNEADYLPRLLQSTQAACQAYHGGTEAIEIIVADDGSTDETASIARQAGYRVVTAGQRSIAGARNAGARAAQGEIVAFADADFQIHPATFSFIDLAMRDARFVGGATGITMERWSLGIGATWYAVMPALWACGFDGGVWFCRRADFLAVGGYDERLRAVEDLKFLRDLKRFGRLRRPRQRMVTRFTARQFGMAAPLAIASCRKWDRHGEWHMLPLALRGAYGLMFSRESYRRMVQEYWYEQR